MARKILFGSAISKGNSMKKLIGLWIDHRKAVIVSLEDDIEQTHEIVSDMEKHVRFANNMSAKNSGKVYGSAAEDIRDRQFGDDLSRFYDEVIADIRDSDSIWIYGPGEAKGELVKRLKRADLGTYIVSVETVDKMTDRQISAKLRNEALPKTNSE
jgi:stalled ribosome rescue protein Dom34